MKCDEPCEDGKMAARGLGPISRNFVPFPSKYVVIPSDTSEVLCDRLQVY